MMRDLCEETILRE